MPLRNAKVSWKLREERQRELEAARDALRRASIVYKHFGEPYGTFKYPSKTSKPMEIAHFGSRLRKFNDPLELAYYASTAVKQARIRTLKAAARGNKSALRRVNPLPAAPAANGNGPPILIDYHNGSMARSMRTLPAMYANPFAAVVWQRT